MRKSLVGLGVVLFLCHFAYAAPSSDCSASAGSVTIVIPLPSGDFLEVGSDKRDFFDHMVPKDNRLLCAFVTREDLARLKKPAKGMSRYMMVEIARDGENRDFKSTDFDEVVAEIKRQLGDTDSLNRTAKEMEEEKKRKLREIEQSDKISIGKPIPIGTLFALKDAYGFALMVPYTAEGKTTKNLVAVVFARVNNRLLFLYLTCDYEDAGSFKWAEEMAEGWTRRILAANAK